MQELSSVTLFVLSVPAVLLTGISKGGFGGALGGIAVPLMALFMSPTTAAAIMLPLLCMADITGLRQLRGSWDIPNLKIMLPGAVFGVILGSLTFGYFSERLLALLIGGIAISFFLLNVWSNRSNPSIQAPVGPTVGRGMFYSGVAGFTSFVAHAGGPPLMMHLLPQKMDKKRFLATANVFFLLTNAVKLLPYTLLGQFNKAGLMVSLALVPFIVLGVRMGLWLQGRINHLWFYRVAWSGLLITGILLIVRNW